ncbi:MAG: PaaI family thioesterase [Burkholderiaceae bacterium]
MLDISRLHTLFEPLFPGLIGIRLLEAKEDRVRATLKVRKNLCTGRDTLHWGVMVGMAQTMGTVGSVLSLPEGSRTRTESSHTDFHADAPLDTEVTAECVALEKTEARMVWQTTIHNADEQVCAVITQTQSILPDE